MLLKNIVGRRAAGRLDAHRSRGHAQTVGPRRNRHAERRRQRCPTPISPR